MHENYREVGLGFDNGQQAGTINVHWSVWQPRLMAWFTMGLVISQLTAYPQLLCNMVNVTFVWMTGMEIFVFFTTSLFVGSLLHEFILLITILLLWLQVTWMPRRGMVRSFANKPWQGHSYGKPINKFTLVLSWISWLRLSFISSLVGVFLTSGSNGYVLFWGLTLEFFMAFGPEFKCNGM